MLLNMISNTINKDKYNLHKQKLSEVHSKLLKYKEVLRPKV